MRPGAHKFETRVLFARASQVADAAFDVFDPEPPAADNPLLGMEGLIATPHIGGSTEEAQEIVGVRIAEQLVEYLNNGVALNAVNMPAMSPEQYRTVGPYISLAERLGNFAAYIASGQPSLVRLVYSGHIAEFNTTLLRNAGLAGVLNRSLSHRANLINSMGIAGERGLSVAERHDTRKSHIDSIRLELETDSGVTTVEGSVVLDKTRLTQVDGIQCEASLTGHVIFMKNIDVPGVIGHVGSVFGRNNVNIASFSLGRSDRPAAEGQPSTAIAVGETDEPVSDAVLGQLLENSAV